MTTNRFAVAPRAPDPISQAGGTSQLRPRPEIIIADRAEGADPAPSVVVLVVDTVDEAVPALLRHIRGTSTFRPVLVTTDINQQKLVNAAAAAGVVRRAEATPEHLVNVISTVAQGAGHLPSDLVGRLVEEVGRIQVLGPRGLHFTGLAAREVDVLRLVAEGYDTADIVAKFSYSERTIKNVRHAVITRLQLRDRSRAVAYAMRQGLI